MERVRINKYLASAGVAARRKADELITAGRVKINNNPAKLGDIVLPGDTVTLDDTPVVPVASHTYLAYHKPYGVISTMDADADNSIAQNVKVKGRFFPVGRLDVHSTGLIILTDDGDLAQHTLHAKFGKEKEYVVGVHKDLTDLFLKHLEGGVMLDDGKTAPAKTRQVEPRRFHIIIKEGRNRQIRRMCEKLGYEVMNLKRIRVAGVELGDLPVGSWRALTPAELESLRG